MESYFSVVSKPLKPGKTKQGVVMLEGALSVAVGRHRTVQHIMHRVLVSDQLTQVGAKACK